MSSLLIIVLPLVVVVVELVIAVVEGDSFDARNAAGLPVAALKKRDRLPVNPRGPNGLYNFIFDYTWLFLLLPLLLLLLLFVSSWFWSVLYILSRFHGILSCGCVTDVADAVAIDINEFVKGVLHDCLFTSMWISDECLRCCIIFINTLSTWEVMWSNVLSSTLVRLTILLVVSFASIWSTSNYICGEVDVEVYIDKTSDILLCFYYYSFCLLAFYETTSASKKLE